MSRRLLALIHLLAISLLPHVVRAQYNQQQPHDLLKPRGGDFEIGTSGSVAHLFNSDVTGFEVEIRFGYFFVDWFEAGISGSLGYQTPVASSSASPLRMQSADAPRSPGARGRRSLPLVTAPVIASGWYGVTEAWARFFPFEIDPEMLPFYLGPFINLEFGGIFAEDVFPFLDLALSIGINFYLTNQIAITPEFGYSLVITTDNAVRDTRFGGSRVDHALVFDWGLSFFF